jgi:hypothetical protein
LLPRERKTAKCFEVPEATHNRCVPVAHPVADEHRRYREGAIPHCRATARPRNRYHRACKQRKPAHSKATPVTKESPHSDQYPRRPRRFQPDTTTSPVSKAPAAPLLRLLSADAWKAKIQRSARNLQAIPQGNKCAASIKAQNSAAIGLRHFRFQRVRFCATVSPSLLKKLGNDNHEKHHDQDTDKPQTNIPWEPKVEVVWFSYGGVSL